MLRKGLIVLRKQYKKLAAALCAMMLLCGQIFGGVYVRATAIPTYDFGNWHRQGDTSARVPGAAEDFLKLTFDSGEEISPENYMVAAAPGGKLFDLYHEDITIITLKEEYLQTLEDGYYSLESRFSAEENYSCEVTDASLRPYGIEYLGMSASYRVTRITYDGQNIDPAYYTATDENGYQQILFNDEEYWKTLQPDLLRVYFAYDYLSEYSRLWIFTPEPVSEEESSSAPPVSVIITPVASLPEAPPASSNENAAVVSTETSAPVSDVTSCPISSAQTGSGGENTNTAVAVTVAAIAVGAAAGCAALGVILLKKYRNKKEDK